MFPERTEKITIEDSKKVKVINPNPHYHVDDFEYDLQEEDFPIDQNQVFIPYQLWGELTEATKQMVIEYNKKVKVVHTQQFVTLKPNNPLFWIHLILNPSQFTLLTFVLHLMTHILWINLIAVNPPAPLPI